MRWPAITTAALAAGLACSSPKQQPATGGDAVAAAPAAPAAGLEIEYRQISKFPTCLGNRRIKIDAEGNVFTAVNQRECASGSKWSDPYPAQPVRTLTPAARDQLAALVRDSGFLALQPRHEDPGVDDGSIQEIDAVIDGKAHAVSLDNTEQPAFARVRQALIDAAN
jgi:hypothetical protein